MDNLRTIVLYYIYQMDTEVSIMGKRLVFKLNELMGKHKIRSIHALSKETGLSRITLTKIYDGESQRIDANTILVLTEYFNCTLNDLIDIVEVDDEETEEQN